MPRLLRAACALVLSAPFVLAGQASAATIAISVSADPVEDAPVTVTLTGTTETARKLFASIVSDTRTCESTAQLQEGAASATRISPSGGAALAPGAYTQPFIFTPPDDAGYRVCGFLTDTAAAPSPVVTATSLFTARMPAATVSATLDPAQYEPGQTLNGRVTASASASSRELRYGWAAGADCSTIAAPITTVALTPGVAVDRPLSIAATAPSYRLCAVVVESPASQREAGAEAVATAWPKDVLIERWRPVPLTDESEQEDRLRLAWKTRSSAEDDTVEIWDTDPADGEDPVLSDTLDGDKLEVMSAPDGQQDVRVRNFLGFREFWWSVGTAMPNGDVSWSAPRSVSVVPSPMDKKRVKVSPKFTGGYSTKRPGTVRLRITSSPRARVTLQVFYRGRLFTQRKYTESVGKLRGIDFKLTCRQQGTFSYVVRMRDPYGNKAVRKGSWTTSPSRCASLRAKEQRKAAEEERKRRERERREREKQQPSGGSGGGGGSNCTPGYSPCLTPGIGDYDCEGGSGNGPNYVSGPVSVSGSDPYDLDRDGDGTGCDS